MGWNNEYSEEEIVKDHTKVLSKIWDNLMPTSYPYVLKFKTNKAVEVFQVKTMGPYHMDENFIDYDCDIKIDNKPLFDAGWNGKDPLTKELVYNAYGKLYFNDMRGKLVELAKYANINLSHFDFGGDIHTTTDSLL